MTKKVLLILTFLTWAFTGFSISLDMTEEKCNKVQFDIDGGGLDFWVALGDGDTIKNNGFFHHQYSDTGQYEVHLYSDLGCNNDTSIIDTVDVTGNVSIVDPGFSLETKPDSTCVNAPLTVRFASYDIKHYVDSVFWDMGDGTTIKGDDDKNKVNYSYSSSGKYEISVTLSHECGDSTFTDTVKIKNSNIPITISWFSYDIYPNPTCTDITTDFYFDETNVHSSVDSVYWDFGDGNDSAFAYEGSSPEYIAPYQYTDTGSYSVIFELSNTCGDRYRDSTTLTVNDSSSNNLLRSTFDWDKDYSIICPGQTIRFYFNQYDVFQPGVDSIYLNFGDGTQQAYTSVAEADRVNHQFDSQGSYPVQLSFISNSCGNDTIVRDTIIVSDTIAVAYDNPDLNIPTSPACPDYELDFDFNPYNINGIDSVYWQLGEDTSLQYKFDATNNSTDEYIEHTFSDTGTYPVSLRLTNVCGNDTTFRDTFRIGSPGNFEAFCVDHQPDTIKSGDTVYFSTDNNDYPLWHFGDGSLANNKRETHSYCYPGQYNGFVELTLDNGTCLKDTTVPFTINVYGNTDTLDVNACESYDWRGTTYSTSGLYQDTIPQPNCDSLITLRLSITDSITARVNQTGDSLQAVMKGASYQWLDCDDGMAPISGSTDRTFVPSNSGNYAVRITNNNCTDTSQCYNVTVDGITAQEWRQHLSLYPNPTSDKFTVRASQRYKKLTVRVLNSKGEQVSIKEAQETNQVSVDLSDKSRGIYFIKVSNTHHQTVFKLHRTK